MKSRLIKFCANIATLLICLNCASETMVRVSISHTTSKGKPKEKLHDFFIKVTKQQVAKGKDRRVLVGLFDDELFDASGCNANDLGITNLQAETITSLMKSNLDYKIKPTETVQTESEVIVIDKKPEPPWTNRSWDISIIPFLYCSFDQKSKTRRLWGAKQGYPVLLYDGEAYIETEFSGLQRPL